MSKPRRLKENPQKQGNFDKAHPWRKSAYVTSPTGVARVRRETTKKTD
jgi:hypothetical protein